MSDFGNSFCDQTGPDCWWYSAHLLSLTPAPPPFSAINSMPAVSKADLTFEAVVSRPPSGPSVASRRLMVGKDTSEATARSS